MARLICGVGINDAGYTVLETANVDGKPKIVWRCPFYVTWSSMMQRCYNKKHQTDNRPTYIGCTVIEKWHVFSVFKKWMETQDWEGNALDKDILFYGNKIYSPKTCVFVNQMTNSFFAHNNTEKEDRGTFKRSDCNSRPYMAYCGNPFTKKSDRLGCFSTVQEAAEARRKHKHSLALRLAKLQKDKRVAKALRTRFKKAE